MECLCTMVCIMSTCQVRHVASKQVGYGGAGKVPPSVTTRRRAALNAKSGLGVEGKGSDELAKQRLARAVRSSLRKDASKNEDALKAMGLID